MNTYPADNEIALAFASASLESRNDLISILWKKYFVFLDVRLAHKFPVLLKEDREELLASLFAFDLPLKLTEKGAIAFTEPDAIKKWLLVVIRNKAVDLLRKKKVELKGIESFRQLNGGGFYDLHETYPDQSRSSVNGFQIENSHQTTEVEFMDWKEVHVQLAIGLLPDMQRECVIGYYFEKNSYAQVSEKLQTTEDAVRGALYHARKSLQKKLIAPPESGELPERIAQQLWKKWRLKENPDSKLLAQCLSFHLRTEQDIFELYYLHQKSLIEIGRSINDLSVNERMKKLLDLLQKQLTTYYRLEKIKLA